MKRASSLRRLLAALRPPPVQTGFPTSLADLVVQNHGRLRSRKQQRPLVPAPSSPAPGAVAAERPPSPPPPSRPLSSPRPRGAPRPELLVGGAVAVALLAVWSEALVAAFTVAALSLLWIESSAAAASRRQRRPAEDSSHVSPIREVEDEAAWSSSFSDSDRGTAERPELVEQVPPEVRKKKKKKRSLRKLLSNKFHGVKKKPEAKEEEDFLSVSCASDALAPTAEQTPPESTRGSSPPPESSEVVVVDGRGGELKLRLPLAAFIPVILAGLVLVGGKLPATALAVLCAAFFSGAVDRSKFLRSAGFSGAEGEPG
ncbi:hypothetical protein BRADI_4g01075v3 [Brachypodium distachyon]|uniref:Uncharacterized protein n=1 Tax=Brachypodium distachyon TaxID=15368 RepID=A0A0Q3EDG9_BRADI|nr:hypothetical protein BRADI_4g01075v3 [Brachypodium distachyon]